VCRTTGKLVPIVPIPRLIHNCSSLICQAGHETISGLLSFISFELLENLMPTAFHDPCVEQSMVRIRMEMTGKTVEQVTEGCEVFATRFWADVCAQNVFERCNRWNQTCSDIAQCRCIHFSILVQLCNPGLYIRKPRLSVSMQSNRVCALGVCSGCPIC
jgi:hypothetical protein